jgi:hypothetical protein
MPSSRVGCGACYPPHRVDPSAGSGMFRLSRSMSLYRAGLGFAPFLPLGVAIPHGLGFADVSPVFTLPSRAEATLR